MNNPLYQIMGLPSEEDEQVPALPFGGMQGQQLADYIKANPGPVATTGINPNNIPVQTSDDTEEETQPEDAFTKLAKRYKDKISQKSEPTTSSSVQDIINKLNNGLHNQDLGEAQKASNLNTFLANAGKGVNQILGGGFHTKLDNSGYDSLAKTANAPVEQVLTDQKVAEEQLKQQAAVHKLAEETMGDDPNSDKSQTMRDLIKKLQPGLKISDSATANQLSSQFPIIEKIWQAEQNAKTRQAVLSATLGAKQGKESSKAYEDVGKQIEAFKSRGIGKTAYTADYRVNNAYSLLNEYKDHLNDMPAGQVELFAQEMAQLAKGGIAGEKEVAAILPPSVASKVSVGLGKLLNNPTGAQMGEFLQTYKPYLDDIQKNARNQIGQNITNVINSKKHTLSPELIQELKDNPNYKMYTEQSTVDHSNDPRVDAFMQANGIKDKEKAIKILKENGRL